MSDEKHVWRAPENRAPDSGHKNRREEPREQRPPVKEKQVYGEGPPQELRSPERQGGIVFFAWFIPALLIFAAGFYAGARWDLFIDETLYDPQSVFAVIFEAFGWYPAFLPIILFMGLWVAARGSSMWKRVGGGFLALVGVGVLYYAAWHYLEKRSWAAGLSDYRTWIWLAAGVVVLVLFAVWLFRLQEGTRQRLAFFGLAGSAYMIANQVVVYAVKLVWRRPRFDDMLASDTLSDFMPWYQPLGPGGSSFPSAHTANAAGIFMLVVLCDIYPSLARYRKLFYVLCWGYIAAMAAARIIMGRHFLSDTLAAAGIMALLFFGLRRLPIYKRGCEAARAGTLRIFGAKR